MKKCEKHIWTLDEDGDLSIANSSDKFDETSSVVAFSLEEALENALWDKRNLSCRIEALKKNKTTDFATLKEERDLISTDLDLTKSALSKAYKRSDELQNKLDELLQSK